MAPPHTPYIRRRGPIAAALALGLSLGISLGIGGCATPPPSLAELNATYERALDRTAPLAGRFAPGGPEEEAAFARLSGYFADLTPAVVADRTLEVYAADAYLNDTLVGLNGAAAIRDYFAVTTTRAQVLKVRFLDRARSDMDYYVRWEMTVRADGLAGGEPVVSYGVTQFRFDSEGRVLIHKDFWDAGTGLYEHVPVLGSLVRRARGAAHPDS